MLTLIVAIGIVSLASVSAQAGIPPNGTFTTSATYWTLSNGAAYGATVGYSDGGVTLPNGGAALSSPMVFNGTFDLAFFAKRSTDTGGALSISLLDSNGVLVLAIGTVSPIDVDVWNSFALNSNYYIGTAQLYLSWSGTNTGTLDNVSLGGSVGNPEPTPTPAPTATIGPSPTPAPTATYGPNSGNAAVARVTVAPTTAFRNSANIDATMTLNGTGNGANHLADIEITQTTWGVCLPSEISQVFTDIPLCLSIPVYHVVSLWLAGVDLIPGFQGLVGVLLFIVIIQQLQGR